VRNFPPAFDGEHGCAFRLEIALRGLARVQVRARSKLREIPLARSRIYVRV
jgi:hypothetical protein